MKLAARIKARAVRRSGELLRQIEPGQGARDGKREVGDHPSLRSEAARQAGMSERQQKQATRVVLPSSVLGLCPKVVAQSGA